MQQQTIENILKPENLDLPPIPKVDAIEWFPFTDSVGDPAIRITVIIPDDTPPDHRERKLTREIEDRIARAIRDTGIEDSPYIRTLTRADLHWAEENKYY